eukprot:scaffold1725_cov355-Pavlova_lutheri.AAC.4
MGLRCTLVWEDHTLVPRVKSKGDSDRSPREWEGSKQKVEIQPIGLRVDWEWTGFDVPIETKGKMTYTRITAPDPDEEKRPTHRNATRRSSWVEVA